MRAISLWEPWASLIRTGAKTWETRHWFTNYRGRLLICAAKRKVLYELIHFLNCEPFQSGLETLIPPERKFNRRVEIEDLHFGKAVAVVDLVDCRLTNEIPHGEVYRERHFGDFTPGRYGWKLDMVEVIKPFEVKGRQGFFNIEYERGKG
jgi:hypothetical protein